MRIRNKGFTLIELLVVIAIIAILAAILFPVFAQAREKARQTACMSNEKQMGTALQMYGQDYDEILPTWNMGVLTGGPGCCPHNLYWDSLLQPYVKMGDPTQASAANRDMGGVWKCPSSIGTKADRSYGMSTFIFRAGIGVNNSTTGNAYRVLSMAEMDAPASTIFVGDCGLGGRLAPPMWGQTRSLRGGSPVANAATMANNQWEWPDRHNGGANYVFADGHAKWLKCESAYPPGMNQPWVANTKASFKACADYFAATSTERDFCLQRSL
jgi:prepilin-type N-terminal cleavage/methylation domain-containing protein/prepilin-type processing-associated H-X9-DG protein